MNQKDPFEADRYVPRRRNIFTHPGFRFGFSFGLGLGLYHLLRPLIFQHGAGWVLVDGVVQGLGYVFSAWMAADQQYRNQLRNIEGRESIRSAGMGAALVTSLVVWGMILLRGVLFEQLGRVILVEPVSLYCLVVFDVSLAIAIGAWIGSQIQNRFRRQYQTNY